MVQLQRFINECVCFFLSRLIQSIVRVFESLEQVFAGAFLVRVLDRLSNAHNSVAQLAWLFLALPVLGNNFEDFVWVSPMNMLNHRCNSPAIKIWTLSQNKRLLWVFLSNLIRRRIVACLLVACLLFRSRFGCFV